MDQKTFIIDCPICKSKVAAIETGSVSSSCMDYEGAPCGTKLFVGLCPRCHNPLAGQAEQIDGEFLIGGEDKWSNDIVRIYPNPQKTFLSHRIPRSATESLSEADRSLQANANIAACVMFGRALEAVCRDVLDPKTSTPPAETKTPPKKNVMLGEGIKLLKDKGFIDDRLYDWSQQLHAFRNLAAHPDESSISISRRDAEDLQSFVYAIIEYIYDLTDRYEDFKRRNP
jgi:hypothetical protein